MARSTGGNGGRTKARSAESEVGPLAPGQPTIKQQRTIRRAEKVAVLKRQQATAKRNRLIGIIAGGTALAAALVAVVAFVIVGGNAAGPSTSAAIRGVQTFTGLTADHVSGTVNYQQTPPVGGNHAPVWLNCAIYSKPVPNENAVHSLEHGSVWVTYDPSRITGGQLAALRKDIPETYAILSPDRGLPSPIVASAWGVQLQVSRVDDPRIAGFIAKYREAKSAPEPGAPCTGGIDGPGKVS